MIGSHCVGLDVLLGLLGERGTPRRRSGSARKAASIAAARGECDLAGVHLLDPGPTPTTSRSFPTASGSCRATAGCRGSFIRPGDDRFEGRIGRRGGRVGGGRPGLLCVNRNRGSGTRVLIDGLLAGARPPGFAVEARSHNAVAAAVRQGRADWGVAIEPVAAGYGLGFLPLRAERYDFAIPEARWDRPAVAAFRGLLEFGPTSGPGSRRWGSWCDDGKESAAMNLGAVILCGGESRRMGQPKAWLPFGDERMLQRVVRLVGSAVGMGPIVVVAAPGQELPPLPDLAYRRPRPRRRSRAAPGAGRRPRGAAGRDRARLRDRHRRAVPRPAWIDCLAALIGDHDLAIPRADGYHHPLAALYRRATVLPAIEDLLGRTGSGPSS